MKPEPVRLRPRSARTGRVTLRTIRYAASKTPLSRSSRHLGFLDERHNDAPSARELIDTFGAARTDVLVGGYFVSPPRLDARVSVDSVVAPQAEVLMRWQTVADEVVQEPDERLYLWFD